MDREVATISPLTREGIRRVFQGGSQSVASHTLNTLIVSPIEGTVMSLTAIATKGKLYPDVYESLHKRERKADKSSLEELVNVIDSGEGKLCERILGNDKFARWQEIQAEAASGIGGLTNYVVRNKSGEINFVTGVSGEGLSREQVISQRVKLELEMPEGEVFRMSPGANNIDCIRHDEYSRNGRWTRDLEDRGGESFGEIQECIRQLVRIGCFWDEQTQSLQVDREIEERVIQARLLGKFGLRSTTPEEKEAEKQNLRVYLTQVVKYAEIKKLLVEEQRPTVDRFLGSNDYLKMEKSFRDCHLSAHGLTERRVAEEMIANWMLPADFQTCWQIEGWNETRESFRAENANLVTRIEGINALGKNNPCRELTIDSPEKNKLLAEADDSLVRLRGEMQRYEDGKPVWNWVNQALGEPFLNNDRNNMKPWVQFVSWMVFTKFKALNEEKTLENYTTALWFPEGNYYPKAESIVTAEGQPLNNITKSLKFIFNGQGDARSQEARIRRESPGIFQYIQGCRGKVGEFARGIDSPWLAEEILGEMSSTHDYDPSGVNRDFLGDFEGFRQHLKAKIVHDYVGGFRNEVWQVTQGMSGKAKAALTGEWVNADFGDLDDSAICQAEANILEKGNYRAEMMLGNWDGHPRVLRDYKELLEILILREGNGTKYLRHKRNFGMWTYQGLGFECICYLQHAIFNTDSLRVC